MAQRKGRGTGMGREEHLHVLATPGAELGRGREQHAERRCRHRQPGELGCDGLREPFGGRTPPDADRVRQACQLCLEPRDLVAEGGRPVLALLQLQQAQPRPRGPGKSVVDSAGVSPGEDVS